MVYLEQQSTYLKKFDSSPIAPVLNEILYLPVGIFSDDVHNATDLSLNLLIALKQNDKVNAKGFMACSCSVSQPGKAIGFTTTLFFFRLPV